MVNMKNIRIPVDVEQKDKNINFTLEQDFDTLDVLSMSLSNDDVYGSQRGGFGVLVGRVSLNGGFGLQNAKVSVFIPISEEDKQRPEINQIYPFESVRDTFPNGLRYNLLPRIKQSNESHIPVGTFPDVSDFTNYPTYLEVYEKYYKFTTSTNSAGDYMIFGVPTGMQSIHMDFDLFDTDSFVANADDLVANLGFEDELNNEDEIPGFIYLGDNHYQVEPKTVIDDMPNIFSEDKTVQVIPFWGDEQQSDIGITRCDFDVEYDYRPTAVFFGSVLYSTAGFSIDGDYRLSSSFKNEDNQIVGPQIDKNVFPPNDLRIAVWYYENDQDFKLYDVFEGLNETSPGVFRLNLPMYTDYYTINEFGEYVRSNSEDGIPTTANYYFEFFEFDEFSSNRRPLWGDYEVNFTPGFRAPADNDGGRYIGGWNKFNFENRIFEYDIFNNERKFYTIKTRYRKHAIGGQTQPSTVTNERFLMDWQQFNEYSSFFNNLINRVMRFDFGSINADVIKSGVSVIRDAYYNDLLNDASEDVSRLIQLLDNFDSDNVFLNPLDEIFSSLLELNFNSYEELIGILNISDVEVRENDGVYLILERTLPATPSVTDTNILTTRDVGGGLYFMPKRSDNENNFWNFPFTGLGDIPDNRFAEVIGNFYSPRINYDADSHSEDDSFAVTNVSYPERLTWLPWKPLTETGNQWVQNYEWILGVGVSLEGTNKGQGYVDVYGQETVSKTVASDTFYYGDNMRFGLGTPIPNSQSYVGQLPVVNRDLPSEFTNTTNGVYKPFNLNTSEGNTDGLFINSSSQLEKDTIYAEVFIEDVTQDLKSLIQDKVYSSYNKSDDNTYNGKYYYFGKHLNQNSLYNIEKLYLNEL